MRFYEEMSPVSVSEGGNAFAKCVAWLLRARNKRKENFAVVHAWEKAVAWCAFRFLKEGASFFLSLFVSFYLFFFGGIAMTRAESFAKKTDEESD